MALVRRIITKGLQAALGCSKSNLVSHVCGKVTVSLPSTDFTLSTILGAVQALGYLPVVLKVGTYLGNTYVTFATEGTVSQQGAGGHGGVSDFMTQADKDLFLAGGLTEAQQNEAVPNIASPAPAQSRRGRNRGNPVAV